MPVLGDDGSVVGGDGTVVVGGGEAFILANAAATSELREAAFDGSLPLTVTAHVNPSGRWTTIERALSTLPT